MKVLLFDGVCNLCNGFVDFIIDRDKNSVFKFASLQSEYAKELLTEYGKENLGLESVFYYNGEILLEKSEAVFAIAKDLPNYTWLRIFKIFPQPVNDWFYTIIAKNRYRLFGKRKSCRIPTKELAARFM